MLTRADTDRRPQRLAALLPGLLCTAVEDITGHPCRRLDCDGIHSATGVDPWAPAPVAAVDLHLPVVRGATTTDLEETELSETDSPATARVRELATELRGAPQVDGRGPRRRHVADAMYADALDGVLAELDEARDVLAELRRTGCYPAPSMASASSPPTYAISGRVLKPGRLRPLNVSVPPAEAGSGNGAGEARAAVSGAPGASHGPSEGEGSER